MGEFRADIEAVVLTPEEAKKSKAGRKPIDAMVLFRMLVLQSLYNLSDEQIEYQVRDRLSFTRFLGLGFEDGIPDGTTLWLFREKLAKAGLIERLFERFGRHLEAKGYIARGGQMVDATIVPVPRQRNSREENDAGQDRRKRPRIGSRNRRRTGRRTRTRAGRRSMARSFFGYKNHVNADARHKLIRDYDGRATPVTRQPEVRWAFEPGNTSRDVYADSAYRSAETEEKLESAGFRSRIHNRASRNRPLSEAQGRSKPPEEQGARPYRACIRCAGECARRADHSHHRCGACEGQDRFSEPRLQYAPAGVSGADGRRMSANNPERADKTERVRKNIAVGSGHQPETAVNHTPKTSIVRSQPKPAIGCAARISARGATSFWQPYVVLERQTRKS